jgi:hypothetical protein
VNRRVRVKAGMTDLAVFENYVEMIEVDGTMVELSLWDTAGELANRSPG